MAIVELKPLKPTEALEFFRAKGFAPPDARFDYRDIWQDQHARSFVVAKAMRDDVLTLLRQAVDQALDQGRTLQQFTADLEPELKRLGWWGESTERDPLTGELKTVQLGSKRRLATIFDANMRAARAAGRWSQIQRTKAAFPYLWYRQVQRESRRKEHRRYHDIILPVDHPAWLQIYPPNGWFCACTVRQLSEAQMRRRGLKVTTDFKIIERLVVNKRTGAFEAVPLGVDPAWKGNPGAAWQGMKRETPGTLAALALKRRPDGYGEIDDPDDFIRQDAPPDTRPDFGDLGLPPEQVRAVQFYVGDDFPELNEPLRAGLPPTKHLSVMQALDAAIGSQPPVAGQTLYRAFRPGDVPDVGSVFEERGYASFTLSPNIAMQNFAGYGDPLNAPDDGPRRVVFRLVTGPLSKGLYVGYNTQVDRHEHEVLLPRGRKFVILAQREIRFTIPGTSLRRKIIILDVEELEG